MVHRSARHIIKSIYCKNGEVEPTFKLSTLDFDTTIIKCVSHLELVQAMRDTCLSVVQVTSMPNLFDSTCMGKCLW